MFNKIEGGACINIQGLDCWIPPEGYVYNVATRKLEQRSIYKRSNNPKDQYWEDADHDEVVYLRIDAK
jgi:hypothetical protein